MSKKRHALVIAPIYPSGSGPIPAAAMRTRGICRALVDLDHRVDVICAMPPSIQPIEVDGVVAYPAPWVDLESLARTALVRIRSPGSAATGSVPGRAIVSKLLAPDRYVTWIPGGRHAAGRLLTPNSLVVSTSARSAHIAARLVVDRQTWVADLNDPWSDDPHSSHGRGRAALNRRLETFALSKATQITTVTPPLCEAFARRYGARRVATLPSGFSFEEFPAAQRPLVRELPLVVLYAGTLYKQFDLDPLYEALRRLHRDGIASPARVRFRFVGRLNSRVVQEAERFGVSAFFDVQGPVARAEALELMASATALLLPMYAADPYALPMKFYEYVGAGRSIIALGPADRFAAELVRQHSLGVVVSNADEAATLIARMLDDPSAALPRPTRDSAAHFSWETTTAKLAEVLDGLEAAG